MLLFMVIYCFFDWLLMSKKSGFFMYRKFGEFLIHEKREIDVLSPLPYYTDYFISYQFLYHSHLQHYVLLYKLQFHQI